MEEMKLWENGTPYYNAEYGQPGNNGNAVSFRG